MTERKQGAMILGRTGLAAGITHAFTDGASLGRSASNDVAIASPFLSSRHARIYSESGKHWVEDLGSRNGTRVDGVAVQGPHCLDRIHVITLADAVDLLYVRQPEAAMSAAVAPDVTGDPAAAAPDRPTAPPAAPSHEPHGVTSYDLNFGDLVDPRAAPPPDAVVNNVSPGNSAAAVPGDEVAPASAPLPPQADTGQTMLSWPESEPFHDPRTADTTKPTEDAVSAPVWELVLTLPEGDRTVYPLKPGANSLGRAEDCDVTVPDPERWLSRHHATLTITGDEVTLQDHDTVNGTFVGNQKIQHASVEPGSTLRLGPHFELTLVRR